MRSIRLAGMAFLLAAVAAVSAQPDTLAIVGATIIDGNGGAPLRDGVVIVSGGRVAAVGPRAAVTVPPGARQIDGAGKFVVPGFVDTNVHLSLYGGMNDRYETLVRYHAQQEDIVLEAAQIQLRHGVTTVRDSYGMLRPLVAVRDRIASGAAIGPRILAAGNIVGWSGPYSISFSLTRAQGLTLFQEQMNDEIAQGAGEELMGLTPPELARAIDAYLAKGPDFIKYGGTSHFAEPTFIGFSLEAQRVIVERAHARGRMAETHATSPEGLRLSIDAGVDGIQHPEVVDGKDLTPDLIRIIREKQIVCSMLVNTITGDAWEKHLKDRAEAQKKQAEADKKAIQRPRTSYEERQRATELGAGMEVRRRNAQALIKAGALVTVGTDNYWAAAGELSRTPKPQAQDHGIGTIVGIEGLVELGMTPAQAIVAATKNGAIAARGLKEFGTIEPGKRADLVVLDADPLADLHNIRQISTLIAGGRVIDRETLPQKRVLSRAPQPSSSSTTVVAFETEKGSFDIEVDAAHAPMTAANFLKYVDGGFYNGGVVNRAVRPDNTIRHDVEIQVIQIQSDPARRKGQFPPIPMERTSVTGLKHLNGAVSMARSGPDTATTSFSIVIGDQPEMDFGGKRNADGQGFAVFGRITRGMDVVKAIHQSPTGTAGPYRTETLDPPIRILKAYRK